MDWNSITLFILGAFGVMSLFVELLISFVKKIPELAREVRRSWRAIRGREDEPQAPDETQGEDQDESRSS